MNKLLALPLLLVSTAAFAKTYVCTFTEPFITVKYYETHDVLTIKAVGESLKIKGQVDMLRIDGGNRIEILDTEANSILSMKLTGKGTDGMSDNTYPYEASLNLKGNTFHGGCIAKKGLLGQKTLTQAELESDAHADDLNNDRDLEVGNRIDE